MPVAAIGAGCGCLCRAAELAQAVPHHPAVMWQTSTRRIHQNQDPIAPSICCSKAAAVAAHSPPLGTLSCSTQVSYRLSRQRSPSAPGIEAVSLQRRHGRRLRDGVPRPAMLRRAEDQHLQQRALSGQGTDTHCLLVGQAGPFLRFRKAVSWRGQQAGKSRGRRLSAWERRQREVKCHHHHIMQMQGTIAD